MFDETEQAEIDRLFERSRKMSRRDAFKVGRAIAFVIPALAVFSVPRTALGQTGSAGIDTGGGGTGCTVTAVPVLLMMFSLATVFMWASVEALRFAWGCVTFATGS